MRKLEDKENPSKQLSNSTGNEVMSREECRYGDPGGNVCSKLKNHTHNFLDVL